MLHPARKVCMLTCVHAVLVIGACSHVPAALELLCDCVINPAFKQEELDEQKFRLQLLLSSPEVQLTLLTEVCTTAAREQQSSRGCFNLRAYTCQLSWDVGNRLGSCHQYQHCIGL